jgi:hypothetical protein
MTELSETKLKQIKDIEESIRCITEQIISLQEMICAQQEAIIDSQKYILRLAEMQKGMERKIVSWPYIRVENKIPRNSN